MPNEDRCAQEDCGHPKSDHVTKRTLGAPSRVLSQYGKREMEVVTECVACKRRGEARTIGGGFAHDFQQAGNPDDANS